MANEAKTMNLFRKLLRLKGFYNDDSIIVEEQSSANKRINSLLSKASKSERGNSGRPDFIITSSKYPDFVIVVECKADIKNHVSSSMDSYRDYAVDGALYYADFLSKEFDVVAIGFSGENESLYSLSHYIHLSKEKDYHSLFNDGELLNIDSYYDGLLHSDFKFNQDFNKLLDYTKELNEILQEKKIKESKRGLLISGILIGLKNDRFKAEYKNYETTQEIVDNLYSAICVELDKSDVPNRNKLSLKQGFEFIKTNLSINNATPEGKRFLVELIFQSDERINGFMVTHKYIDTISQFYVEFLRYANNDKGLGIVLTPPHITELFVELAGVDENSVVLDNCAGTGGFLVSAMKKMLEKANGDIGKEFKIKNEQLIGIEYDDDIYTLLISNMIIHRDGRTNITMGDCFKVNGLKDKFHPTVGLLNPPYKNKGKGTEELDFVLNNLSMLERGGKCVAIMPISCVNDVTGASYVLKGKLLENHTLEAVLSLPEELFVNSKVNTVTCAVVLTAGIPHPANKKTWFGYCRDDGFVKKKNKGRIDVNHTWQSIKNKWVSAFVNKEVIPEFSIMKHVTAKDEWCAEAYLDTDYTKLNKEDFLETARNFFLFNMKGIDTNSQEDENNETL
ncbi:MAG: SAM-dependent methyltransferase [Paludibacteraceae bacterium]|nr:SAM-dependent methyltransferase [Paludibacteraceae bacterium]